MIYRDEHGDRWLRRDMCRPEYPNEFNGVGLESAKLVRACAKQLEGWVRKKIIVSIEPFATASVDLCDACKQPEIQCMRFVLIGRADLINRKEGAV